MNKTEALKIVKDNAVSSNDSYMDFMHERGTFDECSFWKLYNAIRTLGFELRNDVSLPRGLTNNIVKSYEWHLLLIGFHFEKSDGTNIGNLPGNFSSYSLRLRNAVNAFISGHPISDRLEGFLNEDLENKFKNDCPVIPEMK